MAKRPLLQKLNEYNFMKRIMVLTFLLLITLTNPGGVYYQSQADKERNFAEGIMRIRVAEIQGSSFSPGLLWEYLQLTGIEHPDVVYLQAILETGWFKSGSFVNYNNLFGMKVPRIRDGVVTGTGLGHASYDHWTSSVDDYKLWQQYWKGKGFNQTDYYRFLNEVGYATARNYTKTLKKIQLKGHGPPLNT